MVYIKNWTDFETAAVELYAKSPLRVRYCVKFKTTTGQLVLKLTDDSTCIKYKTFSSIILNRFESLNLRLLSRVSNTHKRIAITNVETVTGQATTERGGADTPSGAATATIAPSGGQAKGGEKPTSSKKKKKGKR